MSGPLLRPGSQGAARGEPPQAGAARVLSARCGALGPAPASGAPDPAPAGASGSRSCEPWVREKVLFLLHPERWLGTRGAATWEAEAGGEALPEASGGDLGPHGGVRLPRERSPPGCRAAPRPLLVRVEDYQVTREVRCAAWGRGCATTRTEERLVTAVTFRTGRECGDLAAPRLPLLGDARAARAPVSPSPRGPGFHRAPENTRLEDVLDSLEENAHTGTPSHS